MRTIKSSPADLSANSKNSVAQSASNKSNSPDLVEEFESLRARLTKVGQEAIASLSRSHVECNEPVTWATYMQKGTYTCKVKEAKEGFPMLMVSSTLHGNWSLQEVLSVIEAPRARTSCKTFFVYILFIFLGDKFMKFSRCTQIFSPVDSLNLYSLKGIQTATDCLFSVLTSKSVSPNKIIFAETCIKESTYSKARSDYGSSGFILEKAVDGIKISMFSHFGFKNGANKSKILLFIRSPYILSLYRKS